MPYRDKERQKTYQREWQRQRRATIPSKVQSSTSIDTKTAAGILSILSALLDELMEARIDLLQKARVVAYVSATALRGIELAELEERIASLESKINKSDGG